MPTELPTWATHTMTAAGGLSFGLPMLFQWLKDRRKALSDEFTAIVDRQEKRIVALELANETMRKDHELAIDGMRKDHLACLQKQTEFMTKLAVLEAAAARANPGPNVAGT